MSHEILSMAKAMEPQLIQDRRYLHQNPELSFEEKNTMRYICQRLDKLGITYQSGIAGTGVLAEIRGKGEGKCLLIRADMDALPLLEKSDAPYCSTKPGVMHACGHDVHTAVLLSTCEFINKLRDRFFGTVKFAFQPGEETTGGAKPMIDAGVLENPKVDACIALHVDTDLLSGSIRIKSGPAYASPDDFYITVKGKGGHGAEPQNAIDPILIASQIVTQLQSIVSRNIDPFASAVITIGSIHAGDATNVIPDTAKLAGTARSLDNATRTFLEKKIETVVQTVCASFGAEYEYEFQKLFPPLINNECISELIAESAVRCLGEENCIKGGMPTMAGEDFAYFSQEVPSALFKLGCRNEAKGITAPIHNSLFDVDEEAMRYGLAIFADFALHFLKN